ncbi:3106_t:CDS:2 [Rhizophagus irregularis]|nr:3106_t:CDS:2 [Rhizophagus irregularis]
MSIDSTPITLWCLEYRSSSFSITIGNNNSIFDLKKAIFKKISVPNNVKAKNLSLWSVNVEESQLESNTPDGLMTVENEIKIATQKVGNTFYGVQDNNIRVVVRVPVATIPSIPKNITAEVIKQLVQSPGQLPNRSDLANFLNENPPVKIPLAPIHFFQFKTGDLDGITDEERDIYFIQNAEEECTSLFSKLLGQLIFPPSYGKNENSYHDLWDSIIKNTMKIFGKHNTSLPTLEFDRNTSKRTTTDHNRPDMVVIVRNICPFQGEEKSQEDAEDLSKELTKKFQVLVTFVTLHKPINNLSNKRKQSVYSERIAEFDLGHLSDRIRIMNFLRNICHVLPIIVNLCLPRDFPDFETIIRSNRTVVELRYAITKKFTNEGQVTYLKEIYGMLQANNVRFSDRLEYSSKHSVHLVLHREQQEPSNLKELLQALICILTCLKSMHSIDPNLIMHRDIQWPNIIRHYDKYQRFILIDFDYTTFSPSSELLKEFSKNDYAHEMLIRKHNFKVDIWGIGHLVASCNISSISSDLSSFSVNLYKSDLKK